MLEQNDTSDPISEICLKFYPDQIDVLQATTQNQYWLNGPDPLDYINIYINNDEKNNGLNSHFHYVSLGLSDLYGDERVHKRAKSADENSGYGYELTMRVKKEINEKEAPKWPVKLLQALAKYTFQTGGILDEGDHIPNVLSDSGSKVRHVLVCEDSSLKKCQTRFGMVKFLQIVGCTNDELKFAQEWSTRKILNLMKNFKELGNDYLLVDFKRSKSIFELDLDLRRRTLRNLKKEGSFMSFVKSKCFWKLNLECSSNDGNFKPYDQLTFNIDLETARLFPLILKQRLDKENSFIFNGIDDRSLIFIPENFSNSNCLVTKENPLQSNGEECQVLINKKLIDNLYIFFQELKLDKKMKLSVDYLKQETRNFDLECVFVLDLSNKNIVELDQISSCTNVEIINLSKNNISKLTSLKNLLKLQYANLSNNKISSLEGLGNLESLKTLNLSGNNIQNIDEFYQLRDLTNLKCLILNDPVSKASNPICSINENYRKDLKRILPNLELIDGQSFMLCDEMEEIIIINNFDDEKIADMSKSNIWFDQVNKFSEKKANVEKITKCLNEERDKFRRTFKEISESLEKSKPTGFEFIFKKISA